VAQAANMKVAAIKTAAIRNPRIFISPECAAPIRYFALGELLTQ
jgi:hypothetical protein